MFHQLTILQQQTTMIKYKVKSEIKILVWETTTLFYMRAKYDNARCAPTNLIIPHNWSKALSVEKARQRSDVFESIN